MHPDVFPYYQAGRGVEMKQLGRFFDHPGANADVRLSMLRLRDGGAYVFGSDRAQIAWTKSAGLHVDGSDYPDKTYIYVPRGEELKITGNGGVELHIVEFPRLD